MTFHFLSLFISDVDQVKKSDKSSDTMLKDQDEEDEGEFGADEIGNF